MTLIDNWQAQITKLWSVRLGTLTAILSALEVALPYLNGVLPAGTFSALAAISAAGAIYARLVAQPKLAETLAALPEA